MSVPNKDVKGAKTFVTLILLSIFCLTSYIALNLTYDDKLEFHIQAETEFIRLFDVSANSSNLVFQDAKVFRSFDEEPVVSNFKGEIDIVEGTIVDFERVSNGPLIISFYSNPNVAKSNQSVGTLIDFDEDIVVFDSLGGPNAHGQLDDGSTIIVDNFESYLKDGHSFVFPFSSKISLGSKVFKSLPHQTNPVLRGGEIRVYGKTVYTNESFLGRKVDLLQGDQCYFPENFPVYRIVNPVPTSGESGEFETIRRDKMAFDIPVKNPGAKVYAYGFVSLSERPALSVSLTSINRAAVIKKIGPETSNNFGEKTDSPNYITISNFARYKEDPIFQLLSLALGFLSVLIAAFRLYRDRALTIQKTS